jgi:type IV pili sensor histidine kinase/response regulator
MCKVRVFPLQCSTLLCGLCVAITSNAALAVSQFATLRKTVTQIDRYSIVVVAPTAGQRDLLAETSAISIPNDIENLGDALRWLLRDSGYRLADDRVLSDDVHAMLTLPLPAAHRQFEAMPLRLVVELIVGPAFHIVQDPIHRLLAFERCDSAPAYSSSGGTP